MTTLKGIKILDLSRLYPGPFASMILADHGAEVLCVESPFYKENSLYISPLYRNKKHICLDLKKREGKEVFLKLAKDFDVIIEGFRPGVTKRLGIDYSSMEELNNKIIYCSITGYGQTGPMSDRPGHDINYISESGILDLIGFKDSSPVIPGIQISDAAGGVYASNSILMALIERERSGKGQHIDISITESVQSFGFLALYFSEILNETQKRGDMILAHRYPWYEIYETEDNRYISVGCLESHFWKNLVVALGMDEYIDFQYDENRKEEIRDKFSLMFKSRTAEQWEKFFRDKDVCVSIVKSLQEAKESLLMNMRQGFEVIETQSGPMKVPGIVAKFSKTPGKILSNPPCFGENTEEVLLSLGYEPDEIIKFRNMKII